MAPTLLSTDQAAKVAIALTIGASCASATSQIEALGAAVLAPPKQSGSNTSRPPAAQALSLLNTVARSSEIALGVDYGSSAGSHHIARATTPSEKLIGELRSYRLMSANWDGEGAVAPCVLCLKQAVEFVRLLSKKMSLPEPMVHASGHIGLLWDDATIYADIEFLDGTKLAYFVERNGERHKGLMRFNASAMPKILAALLEV